LQRHECHALEPLGRRGAVFREPVVVGAGERGGEARIGQVGEGEADVGAEEHGHVDALAVHVGQAGGRAAHALAVQVLPGEVVAEGAAVALAGPLGDGPQAPLDEAAQAAVDLEEAGRAGAVGGLEPGRPVHLVLGHVAVGVDHVGLGHGALLRGPVAGGAAQRLYGSPGPGALSTAAASL